MKNDEMVSTPDTKTHAWGHSTSSNGYSYGNGKLKTSITKYGKSMLDILDIKKSFFDDNDIYLQKMDAIMEKYRLQPVRENCKLCGMKLETDGSPHLTSHNIQYYLCGNCGQLNGKWEDSKEFVKEIYTESDYGDVYLQKDRDEYYERLASIYKPKVDFLQASFKKLGIDCKDAKYIDIGAGSGYMVGALKQEGCDAKGVEVSGQQVRFGNEMLGGKYLSVLPMEEVADYVRCAECEVLSFIGVLEHIQNLGAVLEAIRENRQVRYVYLSVPMFSLSCMLEAVFPDVYNRHLGGGHTHLFSLESIDWMCNYYHFEPLSKWIFGSDIMDLYRSLQTMLRKNGVLLETTEMLAEFFKNTGDDLQLDIDKSGFASEIHLLISK